VQDSQGVEGCGHSGHLHQYILCE